MKKSEQPTAKSKAPTHIAYHIRDAKGDKDPYWDRVGVAWENADGKGFNIKLNLFPINGEITIRPVPESK